jgi:hypothetical protein
METGNVQSIFTPFFQTALLAVESRVCKRFLCLAGRCISYVSGRLDYVKAVAEMEGNNNVDDTKSKLFSGDHETKVTTDR